jgi:hypothetical protein
MKQYLGFGGPCTGHVQWLLTWALVVLVIRKCWQSFRPGGGGWGSLWRSPGLLLAMLFYAVASAQSLFVFVGVRYYLTVLPYLPVAVGALVRETLPPAKSPGWQFASYADRLLRKVCG